MSWWSGPTGATVTAVAGWSRPRQLLRQLLVEATATEVRELAYSVNTASIFLCTLSLHSY